tara:strand:+ start:20871 stop:22349 length:1479 start_codon:yes stop_codon:yes gene_type:complete
MKKRKSLFSIHRWIGLIAATWLFLLGITGIFLDHDEWRWLKQTEVPESWLSSSMMRYLPATIMRYVVVDKKDSNHWIGGSERGLWKTSDRGLNWNKLPFPNNQHPQVTRLAKINTNERQMIVLATDDGLWTMNGLDSDIERLALKGKFISMVSPGSSEDEIIGVENFEKIFRLNISQPSKIEFIDLNKTKITGLPEHVNMYKFLFDLHFGYGIFSRQLSTWINDFGGIALMILSMTGFLSWYMQKRWRRKKDRAPSRDQRIIFSKSVYRMHAPIIGLLGIIPILYLSVTGILFNHILTFINWGEKIDVERSKLPYVWRYESLKGEIDQVVAYPDSPEKMSISTRYGVLNTKDGGLNWIRDPITGSERGQLFRADDHVFYSNNLRQFFTKRDGQGTWIKMTGIPTILYDAEFYDDGLMIKNSRGFFRDTGGYSFEMDEMKHPDIKAATLYLFMIEVHTGNAIHPQFKWISDLFTIMGIIMVITGPILWLRRKW